jgi:hypothetical protein
MRIVTGAGLACALAGAIVCVDVAAQTNPRIGKWKLKQEPPAVNIMTYEAVGQGMRVTVDAVSASGQKTHWTYTTMLDGKDAPVTGNPNADAAAVTKKDEKTNEIVYKKNGKVTQTAENVISPDGKTVTVTFHRIDAQGKPVTTVAVYERQ